MHGLFTSFLVIPLFIFPYICENVIVEFPKNFIFATSTSAFQIEGAWNVDGKEPSIWDTFCHENPSKIVDHSNGDESVDSYHLYKKDVEALKYVGFKHYRFSISWPRIISNGTKINSKGIEYYNNLINELIKNDIEPIVTMFHFDLPQYLQNLGGFTNQVIVKYFEFYANVLFENFGDRVKTWITINEPMLFCIRAYGEGIFGITDNTPGIGEYLCGHYSLLSHAAAYRLYRKKFYELQGGEVGISLDLHYYYPKDSSVGMDYVQKILEFSNGWFINPIFGSDGNYPKEMIEFFKNKSIEEGIWSRLPIFSETEVESLRSSADFLGVNYYTTRLISPKTPKDYFTTFFDNDINVAYSLNPAWKKGSTKWLYIVPEALYDLLIWLQQKYNDPKIFITENGFADLGDLDDTGRIDYVKQHLAAVSRAIKKNASIIGYTYWSFLDNFEWTDGYTQKFGLFYVNESSKSKERIPKSSTNFFKELIKNKNFTL